MNIGPNVMPSWPRRLLAVGLLTFAAFVVVACGPPVPVTTAPPAKVNEEVVFSDSKWVVLEAKDMGKTLKSNNKLKEDAKADGKFIQVKYKVSNTGTTEQGSFTRPKLIDAQAREFETYPDQSFYLPEGAKALGIDVTIPAGVTKEFYGIYEVPADATGLKFQAESLMLLGGKRLIELGLDSKP